MFTPLDELGRHEGFEVTLRTGTPERPVTLSDMAGYDVIVAQRFSHHRGLDTWRRARTPFSRLVWETDDDTFSITPENWVAYHRYQQEDIRDAVIHSAEVADLVTVTTEHLAAVMREETGNQNVAVLPNSIPGWVLDVPRRRRERPAIGWQGGASHGADIGMVAGPARRFLKRFPGWDFRLHGTDYRPTIRHGRTEFSPWIPVAEDARGYFSAIDFDIGLAPLLETPFARSKSNVKILEYAALGIPSVASDCGDVYSGFIRHGENGFLVRHEHEWLKYISLLASDDALREKMGAAAKETARAWTIENNWPKWAAAYASLFRPRTLSPDGGPCPPGTDLPMTGKVVVRQP